jgi:YbbR domain-containing protein
MKEKIFKNLSLKILSVVFAVVLWTIIVNIYDPTTSYTFSNVSVQLINTESLTDKNYSYEIVDGGKISVYVSGPKSVVTNIKASDIVATADLSKISAFADYVDIHVSVVRNGQTLNNVEAAPKTSAVRLSIENRDTKTINVNTEVTGKPADGYALVKQTLNPTSIKVTGPSSIIDTIDHAGITFDVTGATDEVHGDADIHLYDEEENEIKDVSIDLSQSSVSYTAQVVRIKTVAVEAGYSGTPKDGYTISSVTLNQNYVQVYGDENALNNLEKIVIPSNNINVDELDKDRIYKFSLENYIDKSLHILKNSRVEVTVKVGTTTTKSITLNTSDIRVNGLDTSMTYGFADKTYNIEIEGNTDLVSTIDTSKISVSADLSTYKSSGTVDIKLSVSLPEGISLKNDVTVKAELKNNNTETSSSEATTATTKTTER